MFPSASRRTVHRRHSRRVLRSLIVLGVALASAVATAIPAAGAAAVRHPVVGGHRPHVGPISEISRGCRGQNAEAEQAVDGRHVYVAWIGCDGIGFARSANGGRSFGRPVTVPGSVGHGYHRSGIGLGLPKYGWDPSVAVAPDHTVYVAYMLYRHSHVHPMVAISYDHGATFARVSRPASPVRNNWGDRPFIAVGPTGTVYLTWDFGRSLSPKSRHGNIVIQKSLDGGKTWSRITVVSPGFPDHGGGVAAPLLVEPGGRLDLAFWDWSGGAGRPVRAAPEPHLFHLVGRWRPDLVEAGGHPPGRGPDRLLRHLDRRGLEHRRGGEPVRDLGHPASRRRYRLAVVFNRSRPGMVTRPAGHPRPRQGRAHHGRHRGSAGRRLRRVADRRPDLHSLGAAVLAVPAAVLHPHRMAGRSHPGVPPVRPPQRLARRYHRHLPDASSRARALEDPAQLGQRGQRPELANLHRYR